MTSELLIERTAPAPPVVEGWDSVELWVGSARATAGFWMGALGFRCIAYAGPETGIRDRVSYLLEQGGVRVVVTGALGPESPVTLHHRAHGDGVKYLSWTVHDVDGAFAAAVTRGARPVERPYAVTDHFGKVRRAAFATYGETIHVLVDRSAYGGVFEPGFSPEFALPSPDGPEVGVLGIDHVVGNVEDGQMERWVRFYEQVMGFERLIGFDEEQISTEFSALRSIVVTDRRGVYMPINEPAPGRRKSQIQEYVESYHGAGVQHIALRTDDILSTVAALKRRGLRFMTVPDTYYGDARERLAGVDLPWDRLQEHNILVDRDGGGFLLQIFSEVVTDRPAVFIEIIERHGASGFGEGNFKALFEAIERDQARRGNL